MATIDLTPLLRYRDRAAEQRVIQDMQGKPMPDRYMSGCLGSMSFVVTLDGQADLEISLCGAHGKPTDAQISAFFRKIGLGVPSDPTPIANERGLLWVVSRGPRH